MILSDHRPYQRGPKRERERTTVEHQEDARPERIIHHGRCHLIADGAPVIRVHARHALPVRPAQHLMAVVEGRTRHRLERHERKQRTR
jgi:hypothetical protein